MSARTPWRSFAPLAVRDAVVGYARRLHALTGPGQFVASPLGAWLVLALAAPAASGSAAQELAGTLGMPPQQAASAAAVLLDDPHPAVHAAAAAWVRTYPPAEGSDLQRWLDGLPAAAARGPIPSQAAADAWVREHTLDLVDRFPLDLNRQWMYVLASALATRIAWRVPFDLAPSQAFASPWRDRVSQVLRTPERGHECRIVHDDAAGELAVHSAPADGLTVHSVIAAPQTPPGVVLDAAHRLDDLPRRSLFELPVGEGHAWTLREVPDGSRRERFSAVLPAWTARSAHDLGDPSLGFPAAKEALAALTGAEGDWTARQQAVARYSRRGFEAAAVSVLAQALAMRVRESGPDRLAELRFDRPYAVVAVCQPTGEGGSPWSGLPVFSAWVDEPQEPAGDG